MESTKPEQNIRHYVGVDVSKRQLEYGLSEEAEGRVPYTTDGVNQLIGKLQQLPHACVVCESTGGYERLLLSALAAAGIEVCLVMPGRVRSFAHAEGLLAKTDRIDARLLRRFGQKMNPRIYTAATTAAVQLRELLEYRRLVVEQLAELTSRQETAGELLRGLLAKHQSALETALKDLEAKITAHVAGTPELQANSKRLQQVQGVGAILAATLLAYVPELGKITGRRLSALLGVAPYPDDSAEISRRRHVRGGRGVVRRVLYMCAVCAARFNPILTTFYKRLRAAGKPAKVAIVAVMRKLVCLLNRMIADPNFVLAP